MMRTEKKLFVLQREETKMVDFLHRKSSTYEKSSFNGNSSRKFVFEKRFLWQSEEASGICSDKITSK